MTDDVDAWHRLAALLPPAEAQEIGDCWDIGEQEAGLGLLVSGILAHDVAISEMARAQLSVLAETWGERAALTPRILQCRGDGQPAAAVTLVEDDDVLVGADTVLTDRALAGLIQVPWIICTRCGQVLVRAHTREAWGDLSYLAVHYAITTPDRTAVARLFPADAAGEAFAGLLRSCDQPPVVAGTTGLRP